VRWDGWDGWAGCDGGAVSLQGWPEWRCGYLVVMLRAALL